MKDYEMIKDLLESKDEEMNLLGLSYYCQAIGKEGITLDQLRDMAKYNELGEYLLDEDKEVGELTLLVWSKIDPVYKNAKVLL